jgi:hypothetical protein
MWLARKEGDVSDHESDCYAQRAEYWAVNFEYIESGPQGESQGAIGEGIRSADGQKNEEYVRSLKSLFSANGPRPG